MGAHTHVPVAGPWASRRASLSSPLARLLGEDKKGISGLVAAGGCRRGLLLLFLRVFPSRASGRPSSLRSRGHPVRRANRRPVIAISQTGRWRLWGEKVMGTALWQARCRARPEPSRLALTHPTPGTTPAPRLPLRRDCGLLAAGHAGLRAAVPIRPPHTWGLPAKASRAFRIFASRKLRCPRCLQKEGLLRRQEEGTIWPCRGKRIFQYTKENREGRSPGEAAAHGHVPRVSC